MGNSKHLEILLKGKVEWNNWRTSGQAPARPDLTYFNLNRVQLQDFLLTCVDFTGSTLHEARLHRANLTRADFTKVQAMGANFSNVICDDSNMSFANFDYSYFYDSFMPRCNFFNSSLINSQFEGSVLSWSNFNSACLENSNIEETLLVGCNFRNANLNNSKVFGASVWAVELENTSQNDLIINDKKNVSIMVDRLDIAQFIYFLLDNENIRNVIDTMWTKVVLILGRFTVARKVILETIKQKLREKGYVPIIFDFNSPSSQTTIETISTIAHLSRFLIVDITDAKSVLQELQAIVPVNPSLPVKPILEINESTPGMFDFFKLYPWFLDTTNYKDSKDLLAIFDSQILKNLEDKVADLH